MTLKVSKNSLENDRLRVKLDDNGDIASVFDKKADRETLSAPARLALLHESPKQFPAWNMDWDDRQKPPYAYVDGEPTVTVVEDGPARVALRVERRSNGSKFTQTIRLAAGDAGDRVEVATQIDWQTQKSSLKASFPMAFGNPTAEYDVHVGVLERGNNDAKKYEVPQHEWFDLEAPGGDFGVAVLNDSKYGGDKPSDDTLRLTLLYTPDASAGYGDQATQDIGRHDILYAIAPHAGDWRAGDVPQRAARLNQPLRAYATAQHEGPLGKSFSLVKLSNDQVEVMALKKAEDSDEWIVRLHETEGKTADGVKLTFAGDVSAAREVDGQEREIGDATIDGGAITLSMTPYSMRSFAVKLATPSADTLASPKSQVVSLDYDVDAISTNAKRDDGQFDDAGGAYPAEQLPETLTLGGVDFKLGDAADGKMNALAAKGQSLELPGGDFDAVYVLAAAADGDQAATFMVGDKTYDRTVQAWNGYVGQWDNRLWAGDTPEQKEQVGDAEMVGLVPGYTKRDQIAWFASHHHRDGRDVAYQYAYLFLYKFEVPAGATTLTLPDDAKIRVFAVSVAKAAGSAKPLAPLYDDFAGRTDLAPGFATAPGQYDDTTDVTLAYPLYHRRDTLHYTTDGSDPTADSPVYREPIPVGRPTTIKSRVITAGQQPGPVAEARYDVNDATPPKVVEARANALTPTLRVTFNEAVDAESATTSQNYLIEPETPINAVKLSDDGLTAELTMTRPLSADRDYHLKVQGVRDRSPGANALNMTEAMAVATVRPVFELADASEPLELRVPELPTKGKRAVHAEPVRPRGGTADAADADRRLRQQRRPRLARPVLRQLRRRHPFLGQQRRRRDRPAAGGGQVADADGRLRRRDRHGLQGRQGDRRAGGEAGRRPAGRAHPAAGAVGQDAGDRRGRAGLLGVVGRAVAGGRRGAVRAAEGRGRVRHARLRGAASSAACCAALLWCAAAAAHPAGAVAAKLNVADDGAVRVLVTFDLPAFAINERPADATDRPMLELLDGGDATLSRYLADARLRFTRQFALVADGRPVPLEWVEFPAAADVRRLDDPAATVRLRLPLLADAAAESRLPPGTAAVSMRFPPALGNVVLVIESPGREPRGELVAAGAASGAMDVTPVAADAPPAAVEPAAVAVPPPPKSRGIVVAVVVLLAVLLVLRRRPTP